MKEDTINGVLHTRLKKMQAHFHQLQDSFDTETIHDFRLEVKKLRGFLRLLQAGLAPGSQLKVPLHLKNIYEATGQIRNIQLHLEAMDRQCETLHLLSPAAYCSFLRKVLSVEKHKIRHTAKTNWDHLEDQLLDAVPGKLNEKCVHNFLVREKLLLIGFLLSSCSDEILHEVRKIIKDLIYNLVYLDQQLAQVFHGYFAGPENLGLMAERLGSFHDTCVFIGLMHQHSNEAEEDAEKAVLQSLKIELGRRREEMKQSLWHQLQESRVELESRQALSR